MHWMVLVAVDVHWMGLVAIDVHWMGLVAVDVCWRGLRQLEWGCGSERWLAGVHYTG